jgi:hypothetical protein
VGTLIRRSVSLLSGVSGRVRVSLIAIAATVALVALIVPLQAGASSVNPASSLTGYLALGFSPTVSPAGFRFYQGTSGTSLGAAMGDYQGFSVNGCKVTTPLASGTTGRAQLAGVSAGGTATQVGAALSNGSIIGLGAKPTNGSGASGTPCGQVNLGESLTVSIGSALSGYTMTEADLDIEAKFGTTINAQLLLGGNLVTPANAPNGCSPGAATCQTDTLPDSGPNCSGCNNWSFKIAPKDSSNNPMSFDTVVLTPSVGQNGNPNNVAFSLEGGQGDPNRAAPQGSTGLRAQLGTRQSVFKLQIPATGTLNCPADNTSGDITGNGITTSVDRQGNADGSPCTPVDYSLTTGDHTVSFRKDLTSQPFAQFLLNVTWPEETAVNPPGTMHTTQITYDGTNYHDVKWCLPGDGLFQVWTPPTGESYCLVTHNEQLQADGKVVVHEQFFGIGDPGLKR